MTVCIPDTSALLVISQKETCHTVILEEIRKAGTKVLISSVHKEFGAALAKKFVMIYEACQMKKEGRSEKELKDVIAGEYECRAEEDVERIVQIAEELADPKSGWDYVKATNKLDGLVMVEPRTNLEALRRSLPFVERNDDEHWEKEEALLLSKFGSAFSSLKDTDKTIISHALAVKCRHYKDEQVEVLTTDHEWSFLLTGIGSFCAKLIYRSKRSC